MSVGYLSENLSYSINNTIPSERRKCIYLIVWVVVGIHIRIAGVGGISNLRNAKRFDKNSKTALMWTFIDLYRIVFTGQIASTQ